MATNPTDITQQQQSPIADAIQSMGADALGSGTSTSSTSSTSNPTVPTNPTPASTTPTPAPTPAAPINPTGYSPLAANEDDSVASRFTGLIQQDSPLMQMASQSGTNAANKRGLLNSNLAVGAADAAAYSAALPIAQADAATAAQKNLQREGQAASWAQLQSQLAASSSQQDKDLAAQMQRLQESNAAAMAQLTAA